MALRIVICVQKLPSGLMVCGKSAAKNRTALGLAADVTKPWNHRDLADVRFPLIKYPPPAVRILPTPIHTRYATPSHLITENALPDVWMITPNPKPAASIWRTLAVRSPAAVAPSAAHSGLFRHLSSDILAGWGLAAALSSAKS